MCSDGSFFAILDINRNSRLDIFTAGHKLNFGLVREKQLSKKDFVVANALIVGQTILKLFPFLVIINNRYPFKHI